MISQARRNGAHDGREPLEWSLGKDEILPAENVSEHQAGASSSETYTEGQPDVFNEFNIAMVDYHIDHRNVVNNIFDLTQEEGDRRERKQRKRLRLGLVVNNTFLVIVSFVTIYSAIVILMWLIGLAIKVITG